MKKVLLGTILVGSVIAVSGCATITKGSNQTVQFTSTPSESKLVLFNRFNESEVFHECVTPCDITLKRAKFVDYKLSKDGFKTAKARLEFKNNKMEAGNAFLSNVPIANLIAQGADTFSGANMSYDGLVDLKLEPIQ